jgi:hypothetical protein
LAALPCDAARRFLHDYVKFSESQAREISVPQFEDATAGLLRYRLGRPELNSLLASSNAAVRGTAILNCLAHPSPERTAVLHDKAPWALKLPPAPR